MNFQPAQPVRNISGVVYLERAPYVGGNANNGANAGLVYVNSNNTASNTNANIGSQLGCFKIFNVEIQTLPLGKKQNKIRKVLVAGAITRRL